jgi:hypothetical protein
MKPFKIGDRVAVYGKVGERQLYRQTGTICDPYDGVNYNNELLTVFFDFDLKTQQCPKQELVHPKQCRRLIKKERKRIWVKPAPAVIDIVGLNSTAVIQSTESIRQASSTPKKGWIEFIEVKKK